MPDLNRRAFMAYFSTFGLAGTIFPGALYARVRDKSEITVEDIAHAEDLAGLDFTEEERARMVEDLRENLDHYQDLRDLELPNSAGLATVFEPRIGGAEVPETKASMQWEPRPVERPSSAEDLAFMTVAELAYLLKTRQVSSTELTKLYLRRLRRYDPILHAVVTYTEERALRQARRADEELAAGRWRGPLHGVPYGAKDLLAVEGSPTTWGAVPYKEQVLDTTAAVVEKLDAAGAVLLAKLSLGALAMGDVWFGGQTKNPWNIEQGASGSSAGPGAAVSAGLVGFAIGSETLGSIVSPATRNGVTGHRPTFGAVSRHGAMTLSWTMDKLGPMARSAEDCALVFDVIKGKEPRDPSTVAMPFPYRQGADVKALRVGYLKEAFEADYEGAKADLQTLAVLRRDLGLKLEPVSLPDDLPVEAMLMTLDAEAAAAFDRLTRTRGINRMVQQGENSWPHIFRRARFIPAVEHIHMNRARVLLMERVHAALADIDVFAAPSFGGEVLSITNLTGHPCVCVPNAFRKLEGKPLSPRREPGSISFIGRLYRDAAPLELARTYQQVTDFHRRRPPIR